MKLLTAFAVFFSVISRPATALSPATPEQLLCTASYVVVGTVQEATPTRRVCAPPPSSAICLSPGYADITVEIVELLGRGNGLKGAPIAALPANGNRVLLPSVFILQSKSEAYADLEANRVRGKSFLFLVFVDAHYTSADAWPLDRRRLALDTLVETECSKWPK
jgi:hypothetical protein